MSDEEISVFFELAEAHRLIREAYHHDMHHEQAPKNALQERAAGIISRHYAIAQRPQPTIHGMCG